MSVQEKQPARGNRTSHPAGGSKPTSQPTPNGSQASVQGLDLEPAEAKALLRQWESALHVKYVAHAREAVGSERKRRWLGVPVVVLSTLVGTAFFTTVKNTYTNTYVQLGLGFLGVVAGLLAAIQGYFAFGKSTEAHAKAAAAYGKLWREVELLSPVPAKEVPAATLDQISAQWSDIEQNSPILSQRAFDKAVRRASAQEAERVKPVPAVS